MPSKYVRKTNKGSWDVDSMARAITAVNNGMGKRKAAVMYAVPYSTLQDRLRGKSRTLSKSFGRTPTFTKEQECEILDHVLKMSKMFYGLTPMMLRKVAFEYAEKNTLHHNFNRQKKICGKDWLYGFLKRNPRISLRKPEATSLNRVLAFNKSEVDLFYSNLAIEIEKFGFLSHQIYNVDETGITPVHVPNKIFAPKGQKQVGAVTSGERGKLVTVVCAISASGNYIPPMFIYGRQRMNEHLSRNGPENAIYKCSKNGWINETLFLEWLQHFSMHIKCSKNSPVLLIMDNHSSHTSLGVYEFCKGNGISVVTIPPHTSHRLQPLDVVFYGPLKTAYNQECDNYMRTHNYAAITQYHVAELFKKAYYRTATIEKGVKGFEKTGIFPLNSHTINEEEFSDYGGQPELKQQPKSTRKEIKFNSHDISISDMRQSDSAENTPNISSYTGQVLSIAGPSRRDCISPSDSSDQESLTSIVCEDDTDDEDKSLIMKKNTVTLQEILLLPKLMSKDTTGKRIKSKRHSQIFTLTPNKENLMEKERKSDNVKLKMATRNLNSDKPKENNVSDIKKKMNKMKQNSNKSDTHSESDDICAICQDKGKNKEWWLKCALCDIWAHLECTGLSRKDLYICHFCQP